VIGREGLKHKNVASWRSIGDKVEDIVVYSCAAANTLPGREGTTSDGRGLMSKLAFYTNATVFAADKIQYYYPNKSIPLDFGQWEGNLLRFSPNGRTVNRVTQASTEFATVMTGICK